MVSATRLMEKALMGIAKQWIAGDTIDDALNSARLSYKNRMNAILNKLGEYHTSKKIVSNTVKEYQTILSSLRNSRVEGGVSIKLTQIGLSRNRKECLHGVAVIYGALMPLSNSRNATKT